MDKKINYKLIRGKKISITKEKYKIIKEISGSYSSWTIWKEYDDKMNPKDGVDDLSIFDDENSIIKQLNDKYIFIALNGAEHNLKEKDDLCWRNFHSTDKLKERDFKLRYALQGTKYWGSFITDFMLITKTKSEEAIKMYNDLSDEDKKKNESRLLELISIINKDAKLIAIGNKTFDLLNKYLNIKEIIKIPHYSDYNSKEDYKKAVLEILKNY